MQGEVYATRVPDLPSVQENICDMTVLVTLDGLDTTRQEVEYRHDIIRAISGSHFDVTKLTT
jgi:hypothetical protein